MKLFNYISLFFALIILTHCRPAIEISTEREPGFDLTNYNTFSFVREDTTNENKQVWAYLSEISTIKEALREQLEEQGLRYVDSNPDLRINIGIVVEEQVQTRPTNFATDPPQYIGQRRYTWSVRDVEVGRYQQGTVTVHLVDNENNELVWMGVAEAVIPRDRERQEKRIKEGVQEMAKKM